MNGLPWYWRVWNWGVDRLRHWRIIRCDYCQNTGGGCDCGACGIIDGYNAGYDWCTNYTGCRWCGRG